MECERRKKVCQVDDKSRQWKTNVQRRVGLFIRQSKHLQQKKSVFLMGAATRLKKKTLCEKFWTNEKQFENKNTEGHTSV